MCSSWEPMACSNSHMICRFAETPLLPFVKPGSGYAADATTYMFEMQCAFDEKDGSMSEQPNMLLREPLEKNAVRFLSFLLSWSNVRS